MKECVFCEILAGRAQASVVWESPFSLSFLDVRPVFAGHVLIVPREHVTTLGDLPLDQVAGYFSDVQLLSRSIPRALGATGSFVANNNIVSQSVPHLHFHVVPRRPKDGLKGFFWPRVRYSDEDHQSETVRKIRETTQALAASAGEPLTKK